MSELYYIVCLKNLEKNKLESHWLEVTQEEQEGAYSETHPLTLVLAFLKSRTPTYSLASLTFSEQVKKFPDFMYFELNNFANSYRQILDLRHSGRYMT